ncbi:MAG: hypothetical protein DLM53_07670 [Candidatus Eremiobacter antarcticus]|nr:polyphenol oxidase family protein [Candidatus Eremiobacteraeota bacterium]PZR61844.1 MAG: hypothetical protein DLM53_07670 [Candidatus Eremiobacter sp. RRmetagenome_bin22]
MSSAAVDARSDDGVRTWLDSCGIGSDVELFPVNQVHGSTVIHAAASLTEPPADADGLWTETPSNALVVRVADCAPVWILAEGDRTAFALVHAGWKGVAAGIIEAAVNALAGASTPVTGQQAPAPWKSAGSLTAAIGPHLRPCCFEVGPEVAALYASVPGALQPASALRAQRMRPDGVSLDLSRAIIARFEGCGVSAESVSVATACTRCNPALLHSYRRNGAGGPLMAAVGLLQR